MGTAVAELACQTVSEETAMKMARDVLPEDDRLLAGKKAGRGIPLRNSGGVLKDAKKTEVQGDG